jgi:hypothetical protein
MVDLEELMGKELMGTNKVFSRKESLYILWHIQTIKYYCLKRKE